MGALTAGPFSSVTAFLDYLENSRGNLNLDVVGRHPLRPRDPDREPIVFTHGDLDRSNIIVSAPGDGATRILAIVDWHQSGWMPAYWEYCKALLGTPHGHEWEDFLNTFLESRYHDVYAYFEPYGIQL